MAPNIVTKSVWAILLLSASTLWAGDIFGTVAAQPKSGADADGGGDGSGYESRKYKFVQRVNYATMRDFVVSIEGLTLTNAAPPTNIVEVRTMRVAQKSAAFTPHVLPVLAGTVVEWPNNDDIYHNVFSYSDVAKFDLGLYKGNPEEKRVKFAKAGRADVFCSIHENMHCIVLVLPNPYFATTDANGHYGLTNVPAGTYKLKAWHERLPPLEQEVTVPAAGSVQANFTMGITNLPTY